MGPRTGENESDDLQILRCRGDRKTVKNKKNLDCVDQIKAEQAGFQFVDGGPIDVLQAAEEPAFQVAPILPKGSQVIHLHQLLQLVHNLVHLVGDGSVGGGQRQRKSPPHYTQHKCRILPGAPRCKKRVKSVCTL